MHLRARGLGGGERGWWGEKRRRREKGKERMTEWYRKLAGGRPSCESSGSLPDSPLTFPHSHEVSFLPMSTEELMDFKASR